MRRTVILIASVLVSALFLWLALRGQRLDEIFARIGQSDPVWVLLSLLSIGLGIFTRALRWHGLVDFKIPIIRSFHLLNITFLLNLLPLRAGEVARGLLATRSGVPFVTAATSIVVERMIDTLLVVILLVVAISRLPNADPAITTPTTLFGVAVVIAFVVLIFFSRYPAIGHRIVALAERLLPFLKRFQLERLLDHMLDGLKPLTNGRHAAHAIVWSLVSWAISLFTFYALERAVGVTGVDLLLGSALAISLASFSVAIPVSVAGIGPFQAAVVVAGQAVAMPDIQAATLSILFQGVNILSYSIWGVIGLLATGVSLGDVMAAREKPAEAPAVVMSDEG